MRWDELFADLEAQAAALDRADRVAEIGDRTRGEVGSLAMLDRARAAIGLPLRLRLPGPLTITGTLRRVGPDWLLIEEDDAREAVVATARLLGLRGLARYSAAPDSMSVVESRLGLRHVLRGIARDRSPTRVHLMDGTVVDATVDRVGADFIEVATHAAGEPRRRQQVHDVELLPLAAVVAVRR